MIAANPHVAKILLDIIEKEGGWSNDPKDAGGATKHGLSLRYARSKGLQYDLDGDGDVDADDIRLVTPETAFGAFLEDFFLAPGFDKLPVELQPQMTDFAVNSGPGNAVAALQRVLVRRGAHIKVDGEYGPKTAAALDIFGRHYGIQAINNELVEERCAFLREIVRRKPSQVRFINGWTKRARSFRL